MERRESERRVTDIILHCRTPARPARAFICDASPEGCRIELIDDIAMPGSTIVFDIGERTHIAGQIVWAEGNEAGVRFIGALPSSAIEAFGLDHIMPAAVSQSRSDQGDQHQV
ncbi:PilZ domain-containing protein [Qipengyuania marisflavi]|uniref:PilZ domain-containing protein n=1 Tax=Qipengyuania marisflavi TaxID=2486356 RepID=UPI0014863C7D|nr:PilZ domain-containing protein [Qipengyuania marisflavi]